MGMGTTSDCVSAVVQRVRYAQGSKGKANNGEWWISEKIIEVLRPAYGPASKRF
jgi:hypothetical protein